jgi:hypothetical protein
MEEHLKMEKKVAHREGRTRSLQISNLIRVHPDNRKSLTLYPIELGGLTNCLL